jgi:diguanylate cyclase (GGDEF)-like protein
VADLFGERLRGGDAVARWGGEEFLLLLPETDLATACDVADRLRATAEARLSDTTGLGASVTLTFGVAVFDRLMRVDACLKQADDALYAGKAEGRNRVVSAAPPA